METNYRIILADDHTMFREAVRRTLEEIPGVEVVKEAANGLSLIQIVKQYSADMVILDISMPGVRGLEAACEIKLISPEAKILMLTMHKRKEYLLDAFSAGADGYLLKEDATTELLTALKKIRAGDIYVSPLMLSEMKEIILLVSEIGKSKVDHDNLTHREKQVLKLIAEGKPSQDIAECLFISIHTVSHHRASIKRKLMLKRTADLVRYAVHHGYVNSS